MGVLRTSAALLVLLGAGNALAQKTPVRGGRAAAGVPERLGLVRIEYLAPAGCPDEAAFIRELRDRSQRVQFARPGEFARTLKITVESRPGHSIARLEFLDTDSRRVKREVSGEDCAEVVSGIALVTALAIDARAQNDVEPPPASKPPPKRTEPTLSPAAPLEPASEAVMTPRASGIRYDAGLGLMVASAVGPSPVYGLSTFFGVGGASWSARLTLARLEGPTVDADRGEASFRLNLARMDGCPVTWSPSAAVAFTPCVAFDAGLIDASGGGDRVARHETAYAFWSAVSAVVRIQLDLQDFLVFEAQGEAGATLPREEFVFREPNATVYKVSRERWGAGAAVGFRF